MSGDLVEVPVGWLPVLDNMPTGLSTTDWVTIASGFGGVLLGSLIGAAVSWFLQKAASKDALHQRTLDRITDQKGRWSKLQLQTSITLSDVVASQTAMYNSIESAVANGVSLAAPLWQKLVPMLGMMKPMPIDIDLLAPLIEAKEYDLVSQAIELSMQHQVLNDTIGVYNDLRLSMKDRLADNFEVREGRIGTFVSSEEAARLAPVTMELESLARAVRERLNTIVPLARSLTFALGPAAQKYFADPTFPILAPQPGGATNSPPPTGSADQQSPEPQTHGTA